MTLRITRHATALTAIAAAALITFAACGTEDLDPIDGVTDSFVQQLSVPTGEAARLITYVNDPNTDLWTLDETVRLNRLAATHIIAARDGNDGLAGTADDHLFGSLEELDAVKYVGPIALQRLLEYLAKNPGADTELVEGVEFTGAAAAAVVWGCNRSNRGHFEHDVGTDPRAAYHLFVNTPYTSITEIAAVYWVGTATLNLLRDYADVWQAQMDAASLAGTFDGIDFDHATAVIALEIANTASRYQLTRTGGIYSTGATRIVEARPYATLGDLASTYGVGPATMRSLHDYAASGAWGGNVCEASLTDSAPAAVAEYASGIWSFDSGEDYTKFNLGGWSTPTCNSIDDPDFVAALQTHLIAHAIWTSRYAEFSRYFELGAVVAGPGRFLSQLDSSLAHMAYRRDDYLRDDDTTATDTYDNLVALHDQVSALADANPEATYSFSIHLDALECSEDASLTINLATGQVLALHKGPAC